MNLTIKPCFLGLGTSLAAGRSGLPITGFHCRSAGVGLGLGGAGSGLTTGLNSGTLSNLGWVTAGDILGSTVAGPDAERAAPTGSSLCRTWLGITSVVSISRPRGATGVVTGAGAGL